MWESETVIALDALSGNRELYEFKIIFPLFQTAGWPRGSLALQAPQAGGVPPGPQARLPGLQQAQGHEGEFYGFF